MNNDNRKIPMRPVLMMMLALTAGCAERNEADAHKATSLESLVAHGETAKSPKVEAKVEAPAAHAAHAVVGVEPLDALTRLSAGNARFATNQRTRSTVTSDDSSERATTAKGQHPFAAILTCADSRVAPELVFDQSIGDLFVVRNAGNIAEPIGEGSVEYGVDHLGIRLIVVLGHSACGAVKAVSGADTPLPGRLADIQKAMPGLRAFAVERSAAGCSPDAVIADSVEHNAVAQATAMLAGSEALRQAVAAGRIVVVPAVYDLVTGTVGFQSPVAAASH